MAVRTIQELKDTFVTGHKPTEANYTDLLDTMQALSQGGGGAGAGLERYFCRNNGGNITSVMFSGPATEVDDPKVTVSTSTNGVISVVVPEEVVGKFSLSIPSEFAGTAVDDTLTVTLNFTSHPFYQSEVTMFPALIDFYSRSAEGVGGSDIAVDGNNPQRRVMPFSAPGQLRAQIGGVTTPYMIIIEAQA